MDVRSVGPLRTASLVWQPRPSTWMLTVVCKATYVLRPGEAMLAPEQEPPNEADGHWNDDLDRSVRTPSDLLPVKLRPEVILVGHAFAPGHAATRSLIARLIVGELDKAIEIVCDRAITADGAMQEGGPFKRLPILYERAAGGRGTWNPVGIRADARDQYGRRVLPNLQPPGLHVTSAEDTIEPIGFGPLGETWPSRAERLGRNAPSAPRLGEHPLPDGFDMAYFNQAPRDQQLSALRENERIVLENLHPEHPRLVTSLPGFRPAAFVERGRNHGQRLHLRPDTLFIDTDRAIATLTFRGQLQLERRDEPGSIVMALQEPGVELSFGDVERSAPQRSSAERKSSGTLIPADEHTLSGFQVPADLAAQAAALPFANSLRREEAFPRTDPVTNRAGLPFQNRSPSHSPSWFPPAPAAATPAAPPVAPTPAVAPASTPNPPASTPNPPASTPNPPASTPNPPPVWSPPRLSNAAPAARPGPASVPPPPPIVQAPPIPTGPAAPPPLARPPASPWTGGAPAAVALGARETVGMAAAAAAATVATAGSSEGAQSGALSASNAAAGVSAPWSVPRRDRRPLPEAEPLPSEPEAPTKELLQLIWFDPKIPPRLRRVPRWKPVLDALEENPPDRALDATTAGHDPLEVEDMREVFEIIANGERTDARGVDEALRGAMRDDGKFLPPLMLLAGELEASFDELASLKAAVALSSPILTPTDESLKAAITSARELMQVDPDLPPTVAEAATKRIREAFVREKKALPADHLDGQMERILLTSRSYQKRMLFGSTFLRLLLVMQGVESPLVVYLPEDVAKKLPMYRRFRARLLVEAHPAQDQYEAQPHALRVFALARAGGAATKA